MNQAIRGHVTTYPVLGVHDEAYVEITLMDEAQRKALNQWFMARHDYLAAAYADAINADETIIAGKQWLFDQRPRMIDPTVNDVLPRR